MSSVARQRRKARKKKRSELRISWLVALKLAGAPLHIIEHTREAGNHAMVQRMYETYINKLKG